MGSSTLVLSVRSTEDHRGRCTLADLCGGDHEPHWLCPRRCSKLRETIVGESVDDKTSTCPEQCSNTHGARLARCVDGPERELAEKSLLLEDLNESRLGMRRQISIRVHPVVGFRDDLAIGCKEGTEGVVTLTARFFGQFENSAQQGVLVHAEETSHRTTAGPGRRLPPDDASVKRSAVRGADVGAWLGMSVGPDLRQSEESVRRSPW